MPLLLCFIAMPFGRKEASVRIVEFDSVWQELIAPAIAAPTCSRCAPTRSRWAASSTSRFSHAVRHAAHAALPAGYRR